MAIVSQWQSASDEDWALALAREAVIRPLTNQPEVTEELVVTASTELGSLEVWSTGLPIHMLLEDPGQPQAAERFP